MKDFSVRDFFGKELHIGDRVVMFRPLVRVRKRDTLLAEGQVVAMNLEKKKVKLSYIEYACEYSKKRGFGDEEKTTWQMSNGVVSLEKDDQALNTAVNELIAATETIVKNGGIGKDDMFEDATDAINKLRKIIPVNATEEE